MVAAAADSAVDNAVGIAVVEDAGGTPDDVEAATVPAGAPRLGTAVSAAAAASVPSLNHDSGSLAWQLSAVEPATVRTDGKGL